MRATFRQLLEFCVGDLLKGLGEDTTGGYHGVSEWRSKGRDGLILATDDKRLGIDEWRWEIVYKKERGGTTERR